MPMLQLRTRKHLTEAPSMVAHVLNQVMKIGGRPGPRVSGTRELPIPLNARALEDANGLYAALVNWAISHARTLGVLAPGVALGWSRRDQDCDGFPSWATQADAAALTGDIASWLLTGAIRINALPAAHDYHQDVHDLMGPLYGRYPRAPRSRATSSRTCPSCDRKTVIVNFTDHIDAVMVACTWCGHDIPKHRYEPYLEEVLIAAAEEQEVREWLTIDEAAEHAEIDRRTVRRYIKNGGLRVYGNPRDGEYVNRVELLRAKRTAMLASQATRLRSL